MAYRRVGYFEQCIYLFYFWLKGRLSLFMKSFSKVLHQMISLFSGLGQIMPKLLNSFLELLDLVSSVICAGLITLNLLKKKECKK